MWVNVWYKSTKSCLCAQVVWFGTYFFFFYAFHKWIFLPRRNEAEIFNLLDKYLSCSSIEALWEYININFQMYMECSGVQCANVNGLNKHNGVLMENSDYKVNQRRRLCWAVPLQMERSCCLNAVKYWSRWVCSFLPEGSDSKTLCPGWSLNHPLHWAWSHGPLSSVETSVLYFNDSASNVPFW